MKKRMTITLAAISIIFSLVMFLNFDATTKQGINYKVRSIKIPLYLKILNFFDRHYNYKWMVSRIIDEQKREEEKVFEIFKWTHLNIKNQPADFPIVDDHVWNIIIRGYGMSDQSSDVFTTLCNYVGVDAFFGQIFQKNRKSIANLSFVNLKRKWRVFDPYNGVSFINKNGEFASLADIKRGDWQTSYITAPDGSNKFDYSVYLENITEIKEMRFGRSNIQSPLNRLLFQIEKWSESFA